MDIKYFLIVAFLSTCSGISNRKSYSENIHIFDLNPITENIKNVMVTKYNMGEHSYEKIIIFQDIFAKETKDSFRNSYTHWNVSDGISLINLVYSNTNKLINCEHHRRKDLGNKFVSELLREIKIIKSGNISTKYLNTNKDDLTNFTDNSTTDKDYYSLPENFNFNRNITYMMNLQHITDIPIDIRSKLYFKSLKLECDRKREISRKFIDDSVKQQKLTSTDYNKRKKRSLSDLLMAPNTKWCGRGHSADTYNELGGASQADKCCRKHDHCKSNIQGLSTKWNLFNFRMYTISHCNCDIRSRRDLSSILRIPGTKWCGKGWDAKRYSDLGGYSKVDRCCRQHDKSCLFWIMGFETKYNFYNWRVNTLMHCKCDERFRTCLKMADTADANLVGKLFFNVVQTKCFVIKWEKICKKRGEDGKCEKKSLRKRAHLRENRKF